MPSAPLFSSPQPAPTIRARLPHRIQVRIGVHTGLVVIGEVGSSEKREMLALGETPNIAAHIQGQAEPDTVVISKATHHLVHGLFECQDLGSQTLKGLSTPVSLYRVIGESTAQNRFEVAISIGLTPLIGRDLELGLLRERWRLTKGDEGQVVLLSGEAGIGKSRLVQTFKEQVWAEAYGKVGQIEEGLNALTEALGIVANNREREYEAELYRLCGELTLQKLSVVSSQLSVPTPQHLTPRTYMEAEREAEGYFLKAIEIARQQQAKSLELRAVMSLVRLRHTATQQHETHNT